MEDWELFGFGMVVVLAALAALAIIMLMVAIVEIVGALVRWIRSGRWRDLWR